jgi:hypothetical protein
VRRLGPVLVLVAFMASGCSLFARDGVFAPDGPSTREATRALAEADAHALRNDYPAALAAYDTYIAKYPDDDRIVHVRILRTVMVEVIALRAQIAAMRDRAPARELEVSKLRQELTARQAEVARLRDDLEALKRTDLKMERRRR